uniref:ACB domain-containing protein n=1 Tax=Panagrellus redivivus TaxID=6233 RepID=A0A7E4VP02_PANRE
MAAADILTFMRGKASWIVFNRPKRRNALLPSNYKVLVDALKSADADKNVMFSVFTGTGDFYTSGNDFGPKAMESITKNNNKIGYEGFVDALIDHRKPIVALVNGPAIGIGCTMLSLADYIVASDSAYFMCPFTTLGLCPEGTSTISFAKIMGYPAAARFTLFSEKITAEEALKLGLVSRLLPAQNFETESRTLVDNFEKLAPQSLIITKELMRGKEWREKMHAVNEIESRTINERMGSDETLERLLAKFGPKS